MKIVRIKMVLLFLSVFKLIPAQEVTISKESVFAIVKKINESILNAKNFSANIQYNIYKTHKDTVAYETSDGFYRRNGANEHSLLVGIETIQNENMRLSIDSSSHSMVLIDPNPKVQIIDERMYSALAMCKKMTKVTEKDFSTIKLYLDEKSGMGNNLIEVSYKSDNYFIKSITLYYLNAFIPGFDDIKNPKIKINYSEESTSRIPKSEFSTDNYIERKNNDYLLKQYYQDYVFSNHLTLRKN